MGQHCLWVVEYHSGIVGTRGDLLQLCLCFGFEVAELTVAGRIEFIFRIAVLVGEVKPVLLLVDVGDSPLHFLEAIVFIGVRGTDVPAEFFYGHLEVWQGEYVLIDYVQGEGFKELRGEPGAVAVFRALVLSGVAHYIQMGVGGCS